MEIIEIIKDIIRMLGVTEFTEAQEAQLRMKYAFFTDRDLYPKLKRMGASVIWSGILRDKVKELIDKIILNLSTPKKVSVDVKTGEVIND